MKYDHNTFYIITITNKQQLYSSLIIHYVQTKVTFIYQTKITLLF
jgi:hypothetical protein